MIPDRNIPITPLITDLPIITTKLTSVGNIVHFEQKFTVQPPAVIHRLATETPTPAASTEKPWGEDYYSPSAAGPLGKPDIPEIKEEVFQSTTVIYNHATDSWDGITEDMQTQESVTQVEQIEVGPLVTSMEISKHLTSKEFSVTETPFVSTAMTLESKTEKKTVSATSESVTTTQEDGGEDRTFTVRSDQSTSGFSQIPEVITVSKTSEDTSPTQVEDAKSVSASTIVSPVAVPDSDDSSKDNWEEKQINGKKTEDFFGQYVSTTPFPSQHHTVIELFPYSGDKILAEVIPTITHPSPHTEMTQGRERTETLVPEMRTVTYANNAIQEKTTKDSFVGKIEKEGFSGTKFPTASSEQIHRTESLVEMTTSFDSPALTPTKLSVAPTEARDVEEDFTRTPVGLESDGYQDTRKYDEGVTTFHSAHSTLNVEVVTVSKWSRDENNTTSVPLGATEQAGSLKLPPALHTTAVVSGKDEDISSSTQDGGDEFTLIPDSIQKPLEKFTEEDTADHGKFTVRFQPTTSISIIEKSTLRDSTTEETDLPVPCTEGRVAQATVEGSALDEGEDTHVPKPVATAPQFAHTSSVEGSAFVNHGHTHEPTTYASTSHTIPLSLIPKTEWGVSVPSVPSEGEFLGEPSQDIHDIGLTISPETMRTPPGITQGTTQEEFPWKDQTPEKPVPALGSTASTAREATAPWDEQEGDGSVFTVSEDRVVMSSERVPILETTPIGKIERTMSYPPGAITEHKSKADEVVTLTPSMGPKVFLSPGAEQKYEIEGTSPRGVVLPLSTSDTQLMEETTTEKREKTPLDYFDLGSGLLEKPKATELPEFPTMKTTVPSETTVAFSSADRLHTAPAFKPSSASTETPPLIEREPSEETTSDMVIIAESTSHVPPTTLEDAVAKEMETDIDKEYFTTSSLPSVTQPPRPPTVEGKEAFRPQALPTPEPPTGTKLLTDINIYIIEVRENKTGKSLLSRHTSQGNQLFILKITFGKKISTYQMLPLEDNWSVKKFCVLASHICTSIGRIC